MRAREDGLTRDIGVSNYPVEKIEQLVDATGETPVVNQIEWSPFGWSPDMLNRRDHQVENLGAFDFEIDEADMEELGALDERYSSLGSLSYV